MIAFGRGSMFRLDRRRSVGLIAAAGAGLSVAARRRQLAGRQSERLARLAGSGHGSQSAADAEAKLVLDLRKTVAGLQSELDRSTRRRNAAEQGTYLLDDGTDA